MTATLRYVGTDRNGNPRTGSTEQLSAVELTEQKFDQGWRDLIVTDGMPGQVQPEPRVLGQIDKVKGRRVWWAER